jgi:hypothetical protein
MTEFTAKQEYIEHKQINLDLYGITLPEWDDLEDYDKSEWEKWTNARNEEQESSNV